MVRLKVRYDNRMTRTRRLLSFTVFMVKACLIAVREPADVVLASSTPLTAAVPGIVGAAVRRAAFVFEVRDLWPEVPIALGELRGSVQIAAARCLERLAYSRATHVIALSEGMASGVREVSPGARVTVVPNASDVVLFDASAQERAAVRAREGWVDAPVLLYAGSLGRSYDVDWLVKTAARLRPTGARVVICGHGSQFARLLNVATSCGLNANEMLVGKKTKAEVAELLPAATVAVSTLLDSPVLESNSLNKVFDALAAGRPIIFNHGGWLSDLVCSNGAGWRLSRNPEMAADQVRRILENPMCIERASAASRKLGAQVFNRDDLFERLEAILAESVSLERLSSETAAQGARRSGVRLRRR